MTWNDFFDAEEKKSYYLRLAKYLDFEYATQNVFPSKDSLFAAFSLTPFENTKVVIIGQDPYHEPGQAMGLSFSVPKGIPLPPSLQNIYREISSDIGVKMAMNGDLTYLARQGVLLLNAILSVRHGVPLSHDCPEYFMLLENILHYLDESHTPMVFLLWGNFAKKLRRYITNPHHLILEATHPSPLSANRGGFFGCKHFSKTNQFLINNGLTPIDWKN